MSEIDDRIDDEAQEVGDAIAVIAMHGRFPDADGVEKLWRNLLDGVESIRQISREDSLRSGVAEATLDNPHYVPAKAYIEKPEYFDAAFFGFSPRDAQMIDPQQRLLMETAWQTLELAGYDPARYPGRIGLFAGATYSPYVFTHLLSNERLFDIVGAYPILTSNSRDFVATRVAYKLGLTGPAVTVQSACSTSLVAIHLSCQSLLTGESDMMLTGGVAASPPFLFGHMKEPGSPASSDGHCRTFDADGTGFVNGQGVALVLLKRLEDAIEDRDNIIAVIRGTAINNDGSDKIGFSAPSISGQATAVRDALAVGDIDPATIGMVEAHGTATNLGDPIEVAGLTQAYREDTDAVGYCALGSIKPNIGHLDSAAGVASFIKAALAVNRGRIPPLLHFKKPNPELHLDTSPFYITTEAIDWPTDLSPRRAGVTSLGIGGTNAHAIVEEPPALGPGSAARPVQLVTLSARTRSALDTATQALAEALDNDEAPELADACYTLHVGRQPFIHRRTLVCTDRADAVQALTSGDPDRVLTGRAQGTTPSLAFLFPGLGPQHLGMARGLYDTEPVYRQHFDECAELAAPFVDMDLRDWVYHQESGSEASRQIVYQQPATFAVEYALAQLWMHYGLRPDALLGHSLGEYAAACVAGVFSIADAMRIIAARGRVLQSMAPGSMLAVALSESALTDRLSERLSLGVINGPEACVVSGPPEDIQTLQTALEAEEVLCRRIHVPRAAHSWMLDEHLDTFARDLESISLQQPTIPIVSSLEGGWADNARIATREYWVRHLRHTVRFDDSLRVLMADEQRVLLEVGPGLTMGKLARRHPACGRGRVVTSTLHQPNDEEADDRATFLKALGQLWSAGCPVDWDTYHADEERHRVPLPVYPFERKRHWVEPTRVIPGLPFGPSLGAPEELDDASARREPDDETDFTPPRNPTEVVIARVFGETLGVPDVGAFDNFFDLGGDSLVAMRVVDRIGRALGGQVIEPATLVRAPTVSALAEVLGADAGADASGEPEGPRSLLVPLQQGRSQYALFMPHAAGGGIFFYHPLARELGAEVTVYGLESRGFSGQETAHDSVEEMATAYIEEIRRVQPSGPYFLAGNSMGGVLSYEMARQLVAAGERVALVGMIDTPGPGQESSFSEDQAHRLISQFGDWVPLSLEQLQAVDEREQIAMILRQVAEEGGNSPLAAMLPTTDVEDPEAAFEAAVDRVRHLLDHFAHNADAFIRYQPQPFSGCPVTYFRARERRAGIDPAFPERPWIERAEVGISMAIVPGNHNTMMHPPNVQEIAWRLRDALRNAGFR